MLPRVESEKLNSRITQIVAGVVVAFAILGFGFWKHQIAESLRYSELAERNRVREVPLAAPRGRILDREGRVIADSRRSYRLVIRREGRQRPIEETFALLAEGMEETADELMIRFTEREDAVVPYLPVVLSEDLSPEEMVFIEARRFELSDVTVEFRPTRRYDTGSLAAHVTGYVGEISERQLSGGGFPDRGAGDVVGKTGLELQYDAFLQGKEGFRRVIVNNRDREIGLLAEQPYERGRDLVTTLDLDLQRAAEEALGDRTGAAVAILPRTGEVVVLASLPAFDPTLFAEGIGQTDLEALTSDPRKPFQNRGHPDAGGVP
jgi:penicillin-binding protein 2